MEASSSSLCLVPSLWTVGSGPRRKKSTVSFVSRGRSNGLMISKRRLRTPSALGDLADTVAETGKSEITWQIIVGAVAGVTPFVVAGVEFSKRIVGFFHGSHGEDSLRADDDDLCIYESKRG
ncbi:hypothetical protein F2Q70_00005118 [Brassica cretica]|uniref:Uncharacterized protein n=1 Tax=Brassica cretica TaxID=69181 RepID=A0A8S9IMM7_BRACR|nr:hypothetical protein F2Q70_00005118 [Brassica cretica]